MYLLPRHRLERQYVRYQERGRNSLCSAFSILPAVDLFSGENVEIRALCIARYLARRTFFKDFFCLWSRSRDLARAFNRYRQASGSPWIAQLARCNVRIRVSATWAVRIYLLVGHVPILDSAHTGF